MMTRKSPKRTRSPRITRNKKQILRIVLKRYCAEVFCYGTLQKKAVGQHYSRVCRICGIWLDMRIYLLCCMLSNFLFCIQRDDVYRNIYSHLPYCQRIFQRLYLREIPPQIWYDRGGSLRRYNIPHSSCYIPQIRRVYFTNEVDAPCGIGGDRRHCRGQYGAP